MLWEERLLPAVLVLNYSAVIGFISRSPIATITCKYKWAMDAWEILKNLSSNAVIYYQEGFFSLDLAG